jgi:hypothetical protein
MPSKYNGPSMSLYHGKVLPKIRVPRIF